MSGRLLALVIVLAMASAAVGAGAAFLLQRSDDAPRTLNQVEVVTPADSTVDQAQDAAPQQPSLSSEDVVQDAPADPPAQATQQDQAQPVEPQATDELQSQEDAVDPPAQAEQAVAEQPEQAGPEDEIEQTQPAPQPDPEPRLITSITPELLTQGEAFALTVESNEATAVAATIGARSWNLIETAPDLWWAVIAIPRDSDTGSTDVVIDIYGEGGAWLRSVTSTIVVLASAAPFEEVVLGGTGISADPAEVQRDHDVRFVHNVAVSGPARWQGPWILPAVGEVTGVFGSKRSYDGVPADGWHHGHDIAADHGDPIVAPAPGTIIWTGDLAIHGMGVIIDHGAGVYSGYWHMSLIAVREGMDVAPGEWLGNIGSTGLSTGPHLHWEVIIQGIDVDPLQWLGDQQPPVPMVAGESEQSADTLN